MIHQLNNLLLLLTPALEPADLSQNMKDDSLVNIKNYLFHLSVAKKKKKKKIHFASRYFLAEL